MSHRILNLIPVTTYVTRLGNLIIRCVVRLLLVQNVGELVVHGVEVILCHRSIAFQHGIGQTVHLIECNLQTALGSTQNNSSVAVVGWTTNQVDNSWHIVLHEIRSQYLGV